MFETYSLVATEENWLSGCLTSCLLSRLERLDAGQEVVEFPLDVDAEYQEIVGNYPGVIERFNALADALPELSNAQRMVVRNSILTQNQFPEVFDAVSPCVACREDLPEVHTLARELFEFSFKVLSRIKSPASDIPVRDKLYALAREHLNKKCCPFCGLERLEPSHPDIPRHDLDHYLAVSRYPFCGVNLRNLAPMGDRCNSSYKIALDVLYDPEGNRLECFDPYGDATASFSLENSEILGGPGGGPTWSVNLIPDSPATTNWDRIFQIMLRLEASLKAEFKDWLVDMGSFLRQLGYDLDVIEDLREGLVRYKNACCLEALPSIARLKEGVASLLLRDLEVEAQQDRTHAFLREAFA